MRSVSFLIWLENHETSEKTAKMNVRGAKWLENRETSVFLSLKGFNYCLLLEFSQVVYYNEGAISRSAPIFRDFQAI